jgi:hypothetical protein
MDNTDSLWIQIEESSSVLDVFHSSQLCMHDKSAREGRLGAAGGVWTLRQGSTTDQRSFWRSSYPNRQDGELPAKVPNMATKRATRIAKIPKEFAQGEQDSQPLSLDRQRSARCDWRADGHEMSWCAKNSDGP